MSPKRTKVSPPSSIQQTLKACIRNGELKKNHEEQLHHLNAGRSQVLVLHSRHSILEDYLMNTSADCYNQYRTESRLASFEEPGVPNNVQSSRRSLRKRNQAEAGIDEDGEHGLPLPVDEDEEEAQGLASAVRSRKWEEQGAAFVKVLTTHVNSNTALPIMCQELLIHMMLNADVHTGAQNLSAQAFQLLNRNAWLHPGARQCSKHSNILYVNQDLWQPNTEFTFEVECYKNVYTTPMSTCFPKLSFLLALLSGAEKLVLQQQLQQQAKRENPDCKPGPLGCTMALKYVSHLLLDDFECRMKVFDQHSHRQPVGGSSKEDRHAAKVLNRHATKLLSGSMLAQLFLIGDSSSARDLFSKVIYSLAGLALEDTAPSSQYCWEGKQTKGPGSHVPTSTARAWASVAVEGGQAAAALTPAHAPEVPGLARKLLCSLYDLNLIMEEEQELTSREQKDTACRMMALTLQRLFIKKETFSSVPQELTTRMQDPSSKAALLSALSPRARVHLLSFVYAKAAAKCWQLARGSERQDLMWLQPLRDYAEGVTSARLICDEGPAKVNPVDLLRDLEVPENFTSFSQSLLVNSTRGDGFVTWLTSFTDAAATATKQGKIDLDAAMLADAFNKVVAMLQVPKSALDCMSVEAKAQELDRLSLAMSKRKLKS